MRQFLLRVHYVVKAGGDSQNYTKDDINFLDAHIVPENIWYLVPVEAFEGKSMLHFCPYKTTKRNTSVIARHGACRKCR